MNFEKLFRIGSLLGFALLILSFFFEYYIFYAEDVYDYLIVYWRFHLISGWNTSDEVKSHLNTFYEPVGVEIPLILNIGFFIIVIIELYLILTNKPGFENKLIGPTLQTIILFSMIALIIYYTFIFPLLSLIQNSLYIPYLNVYSESLYAFFTYRLGLGYLFQILGLLLILPYTLFYYNLLKNPHSDSSTHINPNKYPIEEYIDSLDLDRFIAEEHIKIKEYNFRKFQEEQIRQQVLKHGGY